MHIPSKIIMSSQIEIKLTAANNESVSLKSMSPEALDSFMVVVKSLKSIITTITTNAVFSIQEGSAKCCVNVPHEDLKLIYGEIDTAIKGQSKDKVFASNLRTIQEQLKRVGYDYSFNCLAQIKNPGNVISIHDRLKGAKKISVKRSKYQLEYKLRLLSGFLNQIGGKDPNYHFDYGHGEKITINCSREEAIEIKKYLYQDISVVLLCKEWSIPNKNEYYHKVILESNQVNILKSFFNGYYKYDNLVGKLEFIHDFVYDLMSNQMNGLSILKILLVSFCDEKFHLSELKTLLIISKPFKDDELIAHARKLLLETYSTIRK